MKEIPCGCCEGTQILTPQTTANRPGLSALAYRVGTHATFLQTMLARLSSADYPALARLTTRDTGDPSIALLDAWALVADVLTFYQERIANEGYLLTATERRSILELARLVGYRLRPGVAASVFLAFELDKGAEVEIPAGTRAQSLPGPGELPQPFETAQPLLARAAWNALKPRLTQPQQIEMLDSLTSSQTLYLDGTSTGLKPLDPILIAWDTVMEVYRVQKVDPDTSAGWTKVLLGLWKAPLVMPRAASTPSPAAAMPLSLHAPALRSLASSLAEIGGLTEEEMRRLAAELAQALLTNFTALARMQASPLRNRAITEIVEALRDLEAAVDEAKDGVASNSIMAQILTRLSRWNQQALRILGTQTILTPEGPAATGLGTLIGSLTRPVPAAAIPPRNSAYLPRNLKTSFAHKSDVSPRLLVAMLPALKPLLYAAWRNTSVPEGTPAQVYALRATASLFGHNVPRQMDPEVPMAAWIEWTPQQDENGSTVFLDGAYDRVLPGSTIAILKPAEDELAVYQVKDVVIRSRTAYGISAKTTELTLADGQTWWTPDLESTADFDVIRGSVVYIQPELLTLAEAPLVDDIGHDPMDPEAGKRIELDGLYDDLEPGRWLIVSGERTDIVDQFDKIIPGVHDAELVMLANVEQGYDENLPGDMPHTTLLLANSLAYTYKRDTVTIYGNVAKATHGETREEALGSGDGSQGLQAFVLKQSPLTYLAAPTPAGAESTLEVRVNDVRWHESERLVGRGPKDRIYITRTDDENKTTVLFGDGKHGARLPTGVENVKAKYRSGIGKTGNLPAEQISLLATRPLGVKGVINPLPSTGGADRESRDQARRNAPLGVIALDRLVSVQDYADFCRTFAGIGKAQAAYLTTGWRRLVHLTIAGADDIPIDEQSDLYRNLIQALHRHGDPHLPLQVDLRELMFVVICANVRLLPDYLWESVEPQIRSALLEALGFDRRALGQDVLLGEVIRTVQGVPGVAYVDVDILGAIPEKTTDENGNRRLLTPEEIVDKVEEIIQDCTTTGGPPSRIPVGLAEAEGGTIRPAQLAYLTADVSETLMLTELNS